MANQQLTKALHLKHCTVTTAMKSETLAKMGVLLENHNKPIWLYIINLLMLPASQCTVKSVYVSSPWFHSDLNRGNVLISHFCVCSSYKLLPYFFVCFCCHVTLFEALNFLSEMVITMETKGLI
jgi:hypothetical protein